jgi:hypothetical protein
MNMRAAVGALLAAVLGSALAQAPALPPKVPPPTPDCGSVVIVKCERPEVDEAHRSRREATQRIENRRGASAVDVMDRVIIEDDAIRPDSPEAAINRALSRPLVRQGENSFSIGESSQCTCMNICPPPPFPCCQCTDRVGSRHSTAPGWAPTR